MAGTTSLVYTFLGIDAGAGAQFDRMAGKTTLLGSASHKTLAAVRALGVGIVGAAAVGTVASVKLGMDFQTAMERIHTQANASQKQVAALSKGVLAMAGAVSTTPAALADAAYHIASVGQRSLSTAAQLGVLRLAAEGAKIGGADLTDTTNALTAAVVSGIKGAQDYSKAMGALNATVGAGDMKMQDLANALSTGVTITAKQAGISLNQMGAALAVFGDNNVRGAKAGNQLRMSIQALEVPAVEGQAYLAKLGLSATKLATDMQQGGLPKAISDLRDHMDAVGLTGDKVGATLTEIFGKRAGAGISTLVGEYTRFQNKLKEVNEGGNKFPVAWLAYSKTLSAQFDSMRASVEAFLIKLNVLPLATKAFQWINASVVPGLERLETWFQKTKGATTGLIIGLGALAIALGGPITTTVVLGTALIATWEKFGRLRDIVHEVIGDTFSWVKGVMASFSVWWAKNGADIEEAARRVWTLIKDDVKIQLAAMLAVAKVVLPVLKQIVVDAFHLIGDIVATVADLIDGKWSKALSNMAKAAAEGVKLITLPFTSFGSIAVHLLVSAGEDLIKGLIHGIEAEASNAAAALKSVVGGAVGDMKKFLGIASPSKMLAYVGQMMMDGLIGGWTGEAAKLKDALSTPIQNALSHLQSVMNAELTKVEDRLKASQQKLSSFLSQRKSAISSLQSSIASNANISNVFGTDANGNQTVGNIGQYLSSQVGTYKTEAKDFALLRKKGLSQALIAQLSQLPPLQAIAAMQQILSGADGSIATLNQEEGTIQRYAKATATTVEDSPAEKRTVALLKENVAFARVFKALFEQIERNTYRAASKEIAHHETITLEGKGGIKITTEDAREIAKALRKLGYTASAGV